MVKISPITEKAFTAQVIQYARLRGWKVAHFRSSMNRRGKWSTAVQGDGAGFPDLVLVHRKAWRIVVAELKLAGRKPTDEQNDWLALFALGGVAAYWWTPDDWFEIENVLMGQEGR